MAGDGVWLKGEAVGITIAVQQCIHTEPIRRSAGGDHAGLHH